MQVQDPSKIFDPQATITTIPEATRETAVILNCDL
jgi:hypothetical protein